MTDSCGTGIFRTRNRAKALETVSGPGRLLSRLRVLHYQSAGTGSTLIVAAGPGEPPPLRFDQLIKLMND